MTRKAGQARRNVTARMRAKLKAKRRRQRARAGH